MEILKEAQNNSAFLLAVRANFEFIDKLGVEFWCFHDRDIAPEGNTLEVSCLFITRYKVDYMT